MGFRLSNGPMREKIRQGSTANMFGDNSVVARVPLERRAQKPAVTYEAKVSSRTNFRTENLPSQYQVRQLKKARGEGTTTQVERRWYLGTFQAQGRCGESAGGKSLKNLSDKRSLLSSDACTACVCRGFYERSLACASMYLHSPARNIVQLLQVLWQHSGSSVSGTRLYLPA